MDTDALAVAGDINLATTWAMVGRLGVGRMTELDEVTLVATGLPIAFFNGAFVHRTPSDATAAVDSTLEFFSGGGTPYLTWARESVGGDFLSAARAAGLREAGSTPAMGLPAIGDLGALPPAPAGLDLRPVTTTAEFDDYRNTMARGFGMPLEIVDGFLTPSMIGDELLTAIIGYADGEPAVTALVSVSGETAGIYNVATVPEHRRKGYGAAASWAAVAEGARRGCTHSVLQASEAGYPVYRRMGYVDLGSYVHLEGPPAS